VTLGVETAWRLRVSEVLDSDQKLSTCLLWTSSVDWGTSLFSPKPQASHLQNGSVQCLPHVMSMRTSL
jgi:hypothetical protein